MNIIDIAKLSGVSKSTVSRYLNNGYVSEETKLKIQKVIDETGYIPSGYAKTLRTKKTNLIGVIIPKISSETISKIVNGISEEISKHGYDILLGNTDLSVEKEIEYLKIFKNKKVDGVIFLGTIITPKHMDILKQMNIPVVIVGQNVEGYSCVYHSDYEASYDMVKFLIKKGHRNIGYIGVTEDDIAAGYDRKNGYTKCLIDNNIDLNYDLIKTGEFNQESGYLNAKELLQQQKPDAIFCATYNIGLGVIEYMKEKNINIPNDISICVVGDSKISNVISPKMTCVNYNYELSGIEAAKNLINLLNGSSDLVNIKLGYELKIRESVKL